MYDQDEGVLVMGDGPKRRDETENGESAHGDERYRRIVESSPAGILEYALNERDELVLTGVNPAAERILSIRGEAEIGHSLAAVFPGLSGSEVETRFRGVCREGGSLDRIEYAYADGRIEGIFDFHVFQTAPGSIAVMFTEVERDRKALRESEARSRTLFESVEDCVILGRGTVMVDCNEKTLEVFGRRRDEIVGASPWTLSPPTQPCGRSSRELATEYLERAIRGEVVEAEWTHLRGDGTPFLCELRIKQIFVDGTSCPIAFIRDVTEKKLLEQRLLRAERMETLGLLAGGVAHDFNNLLVPILGHAELLAMTLAAGDSGREQVLEIRKAAGRAKQLVRQLLAFGRKTAVKMERLDLGLVVEGFRKILEKTLREEVDLVLALEADLPSVRGDVVLVEQILLNLVVNAQDAISGRGEIRLGLRVHEVGEDDLRVQPALKPGTYVMLEVRDDGVGMDAETLEHVFEPFFTTKESNRGTGLGLATVYGNVRRMGGGILVESHPGAGSSFRILLPALEGEVRGTSDGTSEGRMGLIPGRGRILLAEDDSAVGRFVESALRACGYEVRWTTRVAEALAAAEGERFDALVSDVIMPDGTAVELLTGLEERGKSLPSLFVTGYSGGTLGARGISLDEHEILEKPFTAHELSLRLSRLTGRESTDQRRS